MEEGMQLYQPGTAVPDWTLRGLRWQGAQILRPDTQVLSRLGTPTMKEGLLLPLPCTPGPGWPWKVQSLKRGLNFPRHVP